jgi:OPA family glycerol-3-phosphate transporter-like MFS transporter
MSAPKQYPAGFRARRGLNWGVIGLMYTSYYMCRYNFPIANKAIADQFAFNKEQMGNIITTAMLAYGCGQIINGLLTDRIGGKRAMLIGAVGTVAMNVLFGVASFWGMLPVFMLIRGVDQYMQAFGAPGMIKINAAWFSHTERGRFAGIFGFMINLGRFGIFKLGPALLAGFTVVGLFAVPALHWRWLFWIPAGIATVVAICLAVFVKDTPEDAGFSGIHAGETDHAHLDVRASVGEVFLAIARTPAVWVCALAYACTGVVRQGVDQWFPRYMQEVYVVDLKSARFQWLAFLIPFVASVGSLASGYLSDKVFKGRRAPVAAGLYFLESVIIVLAAQFHTVDATIAFFVLIALTANSTHSILGTAAAMDIGGRRMAGFASGLIDSFQYFGGALAGKYLGQLLDQSWGNYFYFMAPFGVIGGVLMLTIVGRVSLKAEQK